MLPRTQRQRLATPKHPKPTVEHLIRPHARRYMADDGPNIGTHMFFLFVGPDRIPLTLHSSTLPASANTALRVNAQRNGFVVLEDHIEETVVLYEKFLYSQGKIFSKTASDHDHEDTGEDEAHADREWMRLANAYFLGQELEDEAFSNAALDALIEKVETEVMEVSLLISKNRSATQPASPPYTRTPEEDRLRRLLVDFHVYIGEGTGILEPHEDAYGPRRFRIDVRRGLQFAGGEAGVSKPWQADACQYHSHAATASCEALE